MHRYPISVRATMQVFGQRTRAAAAGPPWTTQPPRQRRSPGRLMAELERAGQDSGAWSGSGATAHTSPPAAPRSRRPRLWKMRLDCQMLWCFSTSHLLPYSSNKQRLDPSSRLCKGSHSFVPAPCPCSEPPVRPWPKPALLELPPASERAACTVKLESQ